jgi:uncharacterized protein DUF4340
MNLKTTVILLLVCGGLIAAVWLIPDIDDDKVEPGTPTPLFSFVPDDVVRLEIRRSETDTSVMVRGDDGWRLDCDGLSVRADEGLIRDIIDGLENLLPDKTVSKTEAGDRFEYGLIEHAFSIGFTLVSGAEHNLTIGEAQGRGYTYASLEADGDIYLIASALRSDAGASHEGLRSKKPVALRDSDVKTVEVRRAEDTLLRAHFDPMDLTWKLSAPGLEVRGAREVIEKLRLVATDLTVQDEGGFVEDAPKNLEKYGLAGTETCVILTAPESKMTRIVCVGGAVNDGKGVGFFWKIDGEPSIYRSEPHPNPEEDLRNLLAAPIDAYRDRNLLQLDYAEPTFIRIVHGDSVIEVVRGDFDWMFKAPAAETPANNKAIEQFVRDLKRLGVETFSDDVKPEDAGFGEGETPTARLEIRLEGQEKASVFEVGKRAGETGWYVRRPWEPRIVVTPDVPDSPVAFLDLIGTPWFAFRDVDVTKVPRFAVTGLKIRQGEIVQTVRRVGAEEKDYTWVPAEGVEGKARFVDAIMPLLARLDPLRAETFVAETTSQEDLASFGLASTEVEISATIQEKDGGETRQVTLRIGAAEEGMPHHATLVGAGVVDALVFTISDEAWAIFTESVIDTE